MASAAFVKPQSEGDLQSKGIPLVTIDCRDHQSTTSRGRMKKPRLYNIILCAVTPNIPPRFISSQLLFPSFRYSNCFLDSPIIFFFSCTLIHKSVLKQSTMWNSPFSHPKCFFFLKSQKKKKKKRIQVTWTYAISRIHCTEFRIF